MIHSRKEREKLEEEFLAPYAIRNSESFGRFYPEDLHGYRTAFQRDRDRVVHSPGFRRLEYKTQVFINGTADHYRTRLTHTFEMTAIARTIARALRVNEDLVETIALAHDIGHSPFGHVGERELDDIMKDHGGFDHNLQSLRWVEKLERRYSAFPGLNLTWEVRAGLRKHIAAIDGAELDGQPIGPFQSVEAQIADVADDIAYYAHDVEDGLDAELLSAEMLEELDIWAVATERALAREPGLESEALVDSAVRALLDHLVEDLINTSMQRLEALTPQSSREVMTAPERIIALSPASQDLLAPHREFLFQHLYWHPEVEDANRESARMITKLFQHYTAHPDTMGRKARARVETEGLERTVCDYISGMTDRYALEEYLRFGLDT
ncbi:MAG: deoxyguanosinetriphosphate triphosphohydrolase [Verrucomicrobiota bacterium]